MAATATDAGERTAARGRSDHSITTLDSGVRVITERVPGVRSVALGFLIDTGSVVEHAEQAGISHLLEHMLFRGTERYGSEEIDQLFDEMGAEINAGTDKESTTLYTRVLDGHLERAFDVMADMIWRPRFGELEAEREVVLEEIAMYEDDPQDRVFDLLGRAIFGAHPLGRPVIGTAGAVSAVDRERFAAYHAERYRPGSIVIAAAGSIEHEALRRARARRRRPRGRGPAPRRAPRGRAPTEFSAASRSWRKTPSSTTCASAARASRATTSGASRCGCSKGSSAAPPPRACSRRSASAAASRTRCSPSRTSTPHTGEVGLYVGTRPDNLDEAMEVVAGELRAASRIPPRARS